VSAPYKSAPLACLFIVIRAGTILLHWGRNGDGHAIEHDEDPGRQDPGRRDQRFGDYTPTDLRRMDEAFGAGCGAHSMTGMSATVHFAAK